MTVEIIRSVLEWCTIINFFAAATVAYRFYLQLTTKCIAYTRQRV